MKYAKLVTVNKIVGNMKKIVLMKIVGSKIIDKAPRIPEIRTNLLLFTAAKVKAKIAGMAKPMNPKISRFL